MTADRRMLPIFTTLLILIAAMLLLWPSSAGATTITFPDVDVSSDKATGTLSNIEIIEEIDPDVSIDWD